MKGLQTLHEASLVRQQHMEEYEAGGDVQIHDRPSRKEARSKKSMIVVEEMWKIVPMRQVVTMKLMTSPTIRR
jgi:3-dehydroquinate synthase class II